MKLSTNSIVLSVFFALCIGATSGYAHSGVVPIIDEEEIHYMVANSDYVFWGTVQTFEVDSLHHALLTLRVDKELLGRFGAKKVDLVVGGMGLANSHNPQSYNLGDQYLFFCFRSFDRLNENWGQPLMSGIGSVLRYSATDNQLEFCSDKIEVRVGDLENAIANEIESVLPSGLIGQADLVLHVAEAIVSPGEPVEYRCRLLGEGLAVAKVLKVIKGEWSSNTVEFRLDVDSEADTCPILSQKDEYIVFLRETELGLTLVRNHRGCLGLRGDLLISNKGISTGCEFAGEDSFECR